MTLYLTVAAIDGALEVYRRALETDVEHYLVGRPSQIVYRRYNRPDKTAQAAQENQADTR